jgi:hypothetical protein
VAVSGLTRADRGVVENAGEMIGVASQLSRRRDVEALTGPVLTCAVDLTSATGVAVRARSTRPAHPTSGGYDHHLTSGRSLAES